MGDHRWPHTPPLYYTPDGQTDRLDKEVQRTQTIEGHRLEGQQMVGLYPYSNDKVATVWIKRCNLVTILKMPQPVITLCYIPGVKKFP